MMIGVRIWDPLPVETLRLRIFDAYQAVWPRQIAAHPVVIVDIDDASLAALGQWPWAHTRVAELLDRLKSLGAVVVGFDAVFAESDRTSPASIVRDLPQLDPQVRAALEALPDHDAVLAQAIQSNRVVLGESALSSAVGKAIAHPKVGFATIGPSAAPFVSDFPTILPNLPALETVAAGHGLFTIFAERDGIVRRVPMVFSVGGKLVPSLTLEILRVLTGAGAALIKTDPTGIQALAFPGFQLPTDPNGRVWVRFSQHDPERFVSAKDLLAGAIPRERIAGKIVLIGTSALGLLDNKTTPTERVMPGVEVHAQVLENVLSHSMLREPAHALAIEVLTAAAVGLGIIALAPLIGPVVLLLLGGNVAATLGLTSIWLFRNNSLLFDASYPMGSSFIVYAFLMFMNYANAQSGRRQIRRAFSQYLSPALVEQLASSSDKLVLGGETRNMTIMFSDVRGFTTISESYKSDPHGLTTLMNRFLTPLTNAILDNRGTIDKYMGDAIMAFWNAPLDDANHECNACRAALDMLGRLGALNQVRAAEAAAEGKEPKPIFIGIGVTTGDVVVGNMGSDVRFDYSVLGDSVNLASRLEGQSKNYAVTIILGDETAAKAHGSFALLELDLLVVKGKSEPKRIWTLLGDEVVLGDARFVALRGAHDAMLSAYRDRDFEIATVALERCFDLARPFALRGFYEIYRERIKDHIVNPPAEDWTGVTFATSK